MRRHEGFSRPGIVGYGSRVGFGEAEGCRAQVPYINHEWTSGKPVPVLRYGALPVLY